MSKNKGGPAFPEVRIRAGDNYNQPTKLYYGGMTLRDYFATHLQADDRLVKAIRAMDDTALAIFALYPDAEREEATTETGVLEGVPIYAAMTEVEKVVTRLTMEAKAIARVRFMQADAMLAERSKP